MSRNLSPSDVFDVNKKTGALILGANRLDDYATKFLTKYCVKALVEPMPLPVEDIIAEAELTIQTASLSKDLDIFGCCFLLDGYVDIYDREKDEYVPTFYPARTLLFDPDSEWAYGEGCKRNTLIHEMLHWEKDLTYFQILDLKNKRAKEQLYPIMCRQSRTDFEPASGKRTKRNEVQWLEWQAHKLAPRILMPKGMFKKKAQEILASGIESCDELVKQLANFFVVSRASAKIRLLEVGMEKQVSAFPDYTAVYADINRTKEYVAISEEDAFCLLRDNIVFEAWVEARGFIFVDGYFVLPDSKYVAAKKGQFHLTKFARANLSKCVINIREQHYTQYACIEEDLSNCCCLWKISPDEIDKRILVFAPSKQTLIQEGIDEKEVSSAFRTARDNLIPYDEETEKELLRKLGDEDVTLCDCLSFLMERRGWNDPLDFNAGTEVHENYYTRIRKNEANNMVSDTLMAICVGLGLRLRLIERVYNKSECKLHYYDEPDKTRIRIVETFPGINITDFNRLLEVSGLEPLGSKSRKK